MASEPPKVFISLQPCRTRLGGMDRCSDQPQRLSTHYSGMGLSARAPGSPKRKEALASVTPPLDGAVVLLEHVVQIWYRPMAAILGESAFGFELRDGDWIRDVAVGVDHPRRGMVRSAQCFSEKALGRGRVLLG